MSTNTRSKRRQRRKAGVFEFIVKNRGAQPHELFIAKAASRDALPVKDGKVDEAALEATGFYRIAVVPEEHDLPRLLRPRCRARTCCSTI